MADLENNEELVVIDENEGGVAVLEEDVDVVGIVGEAEDKVEEILDEVEDDQSAEKMDE